MMGDFVTRGAPLVRVQGDGVRIDHERVRQLIALDNERTHTDDPAYGFRKLVEVARRALGTAANDATTAVAVLNRLHDCLRQIADRPLPNGNVRDEDDELRLIERVLDWDGYVARRRRDPPRRLPRPHNSDDPTAVSASGRPRHG